MTDVGLRRSNNQDSYSIMLAGNAQQFASHGHVFLVADGMGAHAAGELASKLSADNVPHTYSKYRDSPGIAIVKAIQDANTKIHNRGMANADFAGMGTTTSVLVLLPQGAMVAHVGDSRVYRLRRRKQLDQLSFDHSLVWELEARGKLGEMELAGQVPKNIITRSLGPAPEVEVDLEGPYDVEPGDIFLLCSDGLSGQVDDPEIGAVLASMPPKEAGQALIDLSNLRGGPDNITLIIIHVLDKPAVAPTGGSIVQRSSGDTKRPPISVPGLIGIVALLVFALGFGARESWLLAGITLVAMLGTAGYVFRHHLFGGSDAPTHAPGSPFGGGPYRTYPAALSLDFTGRLSKMAHELRDAAEEENWNIDWTQFNHHTEAAEQAAGKQDFQSAVRNYCLAISFMMSELRTQRKRKGQASR